MTLILSLFLARINAGVIPIRIGSMWLTYSLITNAFRFSQIKFSPKKISIIGKAGLKYPSGFIVYYLIIFKKLATKATIINSLLS